MCFFRKPEVLEFKFQKQPSRVVLRKMCSENIQQIYRRVLMRKCDFNKVDLHQVLLEVFQFLWQVLKSLFKIFGNLCFICDSCIINNKRFRKTLIVTFRSSHCEVFLGNSVLKICSKFTGEHPLLLNI